MKVVSLSLFVSRRALGFMTSRTTPSLCRRSHVSSRAGTVETEVDEGKLMQDMLHRIREINYIPDSLREIIVDFTVDGVKLGKVRHSLPRIPVLQPTCGSHREFRRCSHK